MRGVALTLNQESHCIRISIIPGLLNLNERGFDMKKQNNKKYSLINNSKKANDSWLDDWRIQGQEGYLMNKYLVFRTFDRKLCVEDYDQCEFCWSVFDKDKHHPKKAYYQPDEKVWICEKCYNDFKKYFHWRIIETEDHS